MYIGSADLMERNLDRRVETLALVNDPDIVEHLRDVVLADYTQPFNETDPTYYRPLYQRTVETLGFRPKNIAADAAFSHDSVLVPTSSMTL